MNHNTMTTIKSFLFKNKQLLLILTESFLCTCALSNVARIGSGNIFTIFLFAASYVFLNYVNHLSEPAGSHHGNRKKTVCFSFVFAILFSCMYLLVDGSNYVTDLSSRLFRIALLTISFCGFVCLFYHVLLLIFHWVSRTAQMRSILTVTSSSNLKHPALFGFLCCLLCWLPYYLLAFPGTMTPDTINQYEQILGVIPYNNHHPLAHTLLMKLCYDIGFALTHNPNTAVGLYTFFQMCLLAGSVAYLLKTLHAKHIRTGILVAITVFYALIPYHAILATTVWKDIPFAAAVLLFTCALFRITSVAETPHACNNPISTTNPVDNTLPTNEVQCTLSDYIVFVLSGIMVCLFRSNGWYAFLLCFPFLLLCCRRLWKKILLPLVLILAMSVVFKYPVMNHMQVESSDFIESMCIPLQQVAAVICNDRPMTEEQTALIDNVIDTTYIKELYCPNFADNMKELVRAGNQEYLVQHKKEYLALYINLGLHYPADYIKAYVDQTYGYWFPDYIQPVAELEGVVPNDYGFAHSPILRGMIFVKCKEIACKLGKMVPLYGTLWNMGLAFWMMILGIAVVCYRREYKKILLYLPGFALVLSILAATPVATEFRYVYFLEFTLPFYLLLMIM